MRTRYTIFCPNMLKWITLTEIQVNRKMTMPKIKGRFLLAARSDLSNPDCSCRIYTWRSRVPKKTSSKGNAATRPKIAPIISTRGALAGSNEPTMSSGTVNAIKLPKMEKTIVSLVLEGLSNREIAEVTGISEGNVRVKVHRCKKMLKQCMEGN